jgi:predicted GH43/DUF377 family glycosyl hydrolase
MMSSVRAQEVPAARMQQVYEEVKTPYKYGLVVVPESDAYKTDCPTVFRHKGKWYMSYIVFDGRGYETWMASSPDLLNWKILGRILSFPKDTSRWDAHQRAGYVALYDHRWEGSYKLKKAAGKYWLSFIGGDGKGYEAGKLSIGVAAARNPIKLDSWKVMEQPVLTSKDKDVRWWENRKLFKSTIIRDDAKTIGHRYVMYYNANGDSAKNNKITQSYERIGMAVSDDMKTWKRFKTEPVVHHEMGITGDPYIQKIGDLWVMFYFGAFWKNKGGAFDRFACSYDLVNWTDWQGEDLKAPSEDYDNQYAHKPCVIKYKGVVYHFYNAVNKQDQRGIAVATSKDMGKSPARFRK